MKRDMYPDKIQQAEEERVKRREKKLTPAMRVTGKGMKRFATPSRSTSTKKH
jgi:hypothetical protein